MFEMALETFYDPNFHLAAENAAFLQSSSSDNLPEEYEQYQAAAASLLNASRSLPGSSSRISNLNVDIIPGDTNRAIVPKAGASSSVTDAAFAFSEGLNMHRSAVSIVHSDPNLSITVDGAFIAQQDSHLRSKRPQVAKKNQQEQKGFAATSRPGSQKHQNPLPIGVKQDPINVTKRYKKPRSDVSGGSIPDQYISQQLGLSQETAQLQIRTPTHQLPGLIQHHMNPSVNEQRVSDPVPPPQLHSVFVQQQNQQMRNQHQQQPGVHQVSNSQQFDEGACTRRLMEYMHHLRHQPLDNSISYWREFVAEYFAPGAKKRWCVSLYDKVGLEAMSIFRNAPMDGWQCDMCGCRSGRGFEATFEVLPRLNKLAFESGVIDELLFLDLPQEYRFPSGIMMLKCGKAVQESVHENLRVVHQGQLRIVFTNDLKILSWEFCASWHEVFLPRSLVVSQVVHATQKYQSSINHNGSNGSLPQFSKANGNQIQEVGCWLANALDLQSVDNLGFSKRYTRCLQMAEIVHSLKDLMNFSQNNHIGPIESLKNYCQDIVTSKLQRAELQGKRHLQSQNLPTEMSMPVFPVVGINTSGGSDMARESITASGLTASTLPDYNHKLAYQGQKISSASLTNNFRVNGLSSSQCGQTTEHMIQKLLQEMLYSRTVNEVERPVTNLPTVMYNSPEAVSVQGNSLGRTSNSWVANNVNFSESMASGPSWERQI